MNKKEILRPQDLYLRNHPTSVRGQANQILMVLKNQNTSRTLVRGFLTLLNKARYYHNYSCEEEKAIKICNSILKKYPENRDALLIKAGSLDCLGREKESFQLVSEI
ncbi:MAG: hypothetical protein AABW75_03605, partial [Nanoarchaeota archaeon]